MCFISYYYADGLAWLGSARQRPRAARRHRRQTASCPSAASLADNGLAWIGGKTYQLRANRPHGLRPVAAGNYLMRFFVGRNPHLLHFLRTSYFWFSSFMVYQCVRSRVQEGLQLPCWLLYVYHMCVHVCTNDILQEFGIISVIIQCVRAAKMLLLLNYYYYLWWFIVALICIVCLLCNIIVLFTLFF